MDAEGGLVDEDAILKELENIDSQGAYQHYKPLRSAADEFIRWAANPQERVYTGIPDLDAVMRGTAPGELTLIQGFTHSGKTLVATEIMLNNRDTNMVLFTPDETRPLVLTKLASVLHGIDIRDVERRIQQDDDSARRLLLETADQFASLAVFDENVSITAMSRMLDETRHATDRQVAAVIFDYAALLEGQEDIRGKLSALKSWGKREHVAMFVIHQASRSSGSSGRKMNIDSGEYGGEQQSTHVIGVRRKKYAHLAMLSALEEKIANASNPTSIEQYQSKMREIREVLIPLDENTITVSLVKNKRPPCELLDDQDYLIDPDTGKLRRQQEHVDPLSGAVVRTTKAALRSVTPKPWEDREMF